MKLPGARAFKGGVHPSERKHLTDEKPIREISASSEVYIPVSMHIGAPCKPKVKRGDRVFVGTLIADSDAFVSAPIHSSISGKVKAVAERPHPIGKRELTIVVENDGAYEKDEAIESPGNWQDMDEKDIISEVRKAGIVGMGGATFPTHVKLAPPPDFNIDTVILNGCECEPCLTSDHSLMLENTSDVIEGMKIFMKAAGATKGVIAVESNKMNAVERIIEENEEESIEVRTLPVKYPQGAEKTLIQSVTGREVPSGKLPMNVGVLVGNVATAAKVAEYFRTGEPLIKRVVTITGEQVNEPGNYLVRVGTTFSHAIEQAGGLSEVPAKVIMGGPMMGITQFTLDVPVIKGTSGILIIGSSECRYREPQKAICIRCGACLDACPMRLVPSAYAIYGSGRRWDLMDRYYVDDCIECGCCAFVCPAHNPIVHFVKVGKQEIRLMKQRISEKEEDASKSSSENSKE